MQIIYYYKFFVNVKSNYTIIVELLTITWYLTSLVLNFSLPMMIGTSSTLSDNCFNSDSIPLRSLLPGKYPEK